MTTIDDRILRAIPHRPPMLLVDEIIAQQAQAIECRKVIRPDEYFLQGHYPNFPLVPGIILCEMGMQAGAILLALLYPDDGGSETGVPVATRLENVKFRRMVRPSDVVQIHVELVERLSRAFFLRAKLSVDGQVVCRFDFGCALAPAGEFS
jgi:3-hydroxyacyl-[acyl-carrier-protein] dehydratase